MDKKILLTLGFTLLTYGVTFAVLSQNQSTDSVVYPLALNMKKQKPSFFQRSQPIKDRYAAKTSRAWESDPLPMGSSSSQPTYEYNRPVENFDAEDYLDTKLSDKGPTTPGLKPSESFNDDDKKKDLGLFGQQWMESLTPEERAELEALQRALALDDYDMFNFDDEDE